MDPSKPLELMVAFHNRFRWPLRDADVIEVWQGLEYLGELSARLVREVLGHHIATAQLAAAVLGALNRPSARRDYFEGKPPTRAAGRRQKGNRRDGSTGME